MNGKGLVCAGMLLFGMALLGGCGTKNEVVVFPEESEDTLTLTFFGNKYEAENVTVIEEIISDFMEQNPNIRVAYESLKGADYYDALKKRMETGNGDDVFMVNHDAVLSLRESGKLAELSGLSTIDNFTEQMRSQMEDEGKIYWVPTTVSAFGLYCNLDLLEAHGQKVPENLPQWEETCAYFVEKGITPVIANNDISLKTMAIGKGFYEIYQEGRQAEVLGAINRGEETLGTYLEPGFALAEEFIQKGYIDASAALETQKTSDDLEQFAKGEAPFMLTGAWAAGRLESLEPDFAFEVAPYPILEDGKLLVTNPDTRLSVNAQSGHLEEAMSFVEFFTQAENIRRFADQQSSFSPVKDGTPSTAAEIQPLIETYEAGHTVIGSDGLLELPIWELTAEASEKLLAQEPLKDVMQWLDMQAEEERE